MFEIYREMPKEGSFPKASAGRIEALEMDEMRKGIRMSWKSEGARRGAKTGPNPLKILQIPTCIRANSRHGRARRSFFL
jgi:hypothetical protein